jgi:hypothetical protein
VVVERQYGAVANYQSVAHVFLSVVASVCD